MDRLSALSSQIKPNYTGHRFTPRSTEDVVICGAVRTPLTKSKRGALKDTAPEVLLAHVLKSLVERCKVDPKTIPDIVVGNVAQPGAGAMTSKMGLFLAGFPETTCMQVVNRWCSSGLEACAIVAAKIRAGMLDVGIGAGVEQMTLFDMQGQLDPEKLDDSVFEHPVARDCMMGMGQTSENVVDKFGITREEQDAFAVESHRRAALAQEQGLFNDEIVPITVKVKKGDKEEEVLVTKDDGIRKETTMQTLGKLKPAFKKNGSTTAGNSSQVTDGAAAVLLARRSYAQEKGLPILARFIDYTVAGVPPNIMGIAPAFAIPQLLEKTGVRKEEVDIYELNEAFASQATYCIKKVGLDAKKVNPKGGAIAFGHPLGCTGARQIATLLPEMKRQKAKFGVISMCIATGQGAAALIENEQL